MSDPSPRYSLRGKRALVTGAGTRLGRAIALALGRAGMQIAVHYHSNRAGAEQTAQDLAASGSQAQLYCADLSQPEAARELIDEVTSAGAGLDLLVPSAANFERVELAAIDLAAWERALSLNLTASFLLAQQAAPALRASRGSLVFITCASVEAPYRHYLPYVVSKAGVYQMMRALALELAPWVRVNAVAPGTVLPPAEMSAEVLEQLRRRIPLQRLGSPEDVAEAVVFLAASSFITGQQLLVDGGRSLSRSPELS